MGVGAGAVAPAPTGMTGRSEGGEEVLHLLDLGGLGVDDRLRELDGVRVAAVVDLRLGHLDRSLVMADHLLQEQLRRLGTLS